MKVWDAMKSTWFWKLALLDLYLKARGMIARTFEHAPQISARKLGFFF
jgi:hypothetical protein